MAEPLGAEKLAAIKARQQQTWASGDFAEVGSRIVLVSELLCEAVDLRPGQRVLDVATGSGNTAIAAARRFCDATGIDYVPALLDRARERAAAEWLEVEFVEGDAEQLPVPDAAFDVVLSTFGVMFAPDQARAAAELLRVCTPGGTIGLANWTPDGFVAEVFRAAARHVPPPPVPSVFRWGDEAALRELFGDRVESLSCTRRSFAFRFRSPEHWLEFNRTNFGPLLRAFGALDPAAQDALADDLIAVLTRFDRSGGEMLRIDGEYLEVVARVR